MTEKVRSQLLYYINLIGEKYQKIGTVSVKADLSSSIQSILSVPVSELGKLMSEVDYSILPFIYSQIYTKNCQVQIVGVIELQFPSLETPWYTDVTFFPGHRLLDIDYILSVVGNVIGPVE
ncbi:hypothetical protein CHS0354_003504 [Potamilus streckersoni]|uniref:Uncharacterized protein n=1 Tax=Potamilus streckersoni TaxID=2493646 RepID=A0AAE0SYR3_9BIVA|nr:hypothetical protein CHS0354_003504 [Potamilus streckersoni]